MRPFASFLFFPLIMLVSVFLRNKPSPTRHVAAAHRHPTQFHSPFMMRSFSSTDLLPLVQHHLRRQARRPCTYYHGVTHTLLLSASSYERFPALDIMLPTGPKVLSISQHTIGMTLPCHASCCICRDIDTFLVVRFYAPLLTLSCIRLPRRT